MVPFWSGWKLPSCARAHVGEAGSCVHRGAVTSRPDPFLGSSGLASRTFNCVDHRPLPSSVVMGCRLAAASPPRALLFL
eukprot:5064631-Prymnesium_polylepis.1